MGPIDGQRQERLHRKTIRLPAPTYNEPGLRALITMATADRQPTFADVNLAKDCVDLLRSYAVHHSVAVLGYCLMPDHMHLLLRVDGETGIVDFVRIYKSATTRRWWQSGASGQLWQRSFHDHLLRDREEETEYLTYILMNPVRAGLADAWEHYSYSGSFAYDLVDWTYWSSD